MSERTFISVIIPALNEARSISDCLEALLRCKESYSNMEIIVVDNGSTDQTINIASAYPVTVLECHQPGVSGARNLGAKHAKGQILAFIDADCVIGSNALSTATTLLSSADVAACGGIPTARKNAPWVERAWALAKHSDHHETDILSSASLYVKKQNFREIGGFNEDLPAGEDTDLSKRLRRHYRLFLHPDLDITHLGYPSTLRGFFQRQVWQSSRYLQSKKYGIDYVLLATLAYLALGFTAIFTMLVAKPTISLLLIFCMAILAASLGLYRVRKARIPLTLTLFGQVVLLNGLYLTARACGLSLSLASSLMARRKPASV